MASTDDRKWSSGAAAVTAPPPPAPRGVPSTGTAPGAHRGAGLTQRFGQTERKDAWWLIPALQAAGLIVLIGYANWAAFLDADGSDDPAQLPELLEPILAGRSDLVIGSRALGEQERGALTPVQAAGNRLAVLLLRWAFGARFTDLGPFRAVRWGALEGLRMRDRDYGWTVEMQARAARARLRTAEIPVRYRRRVGRSKISGTLRGAAGAGWKILFTIARVRLGG